MRKTIAILTHLVFWTWNLIFIGIVDIWMLPQFGLDLFFDARNGLVEPTFVVSFLILLIVPVVCTILGFWRLRSRPTLLLRLFYGVEAPLFTLCLLRLFLIRELTAASAFTLGLVIFSILMFAIEILAGYAAHNERLSWVQMVGHSFMLLVGGYVGSLLLLYTVPALVWGALGFLGGLFNVLGSTNFGDGLRFLGDLISHPLESTVAGLFLFLFSSSFLIFVSMPYAFVHFYIRAWERIHKAFGRQYGTQNSWAITGVTVALSCLLFIGLQFQQPQAKAFELLAPTEAASELVSSSSASSLPPSELKSRQRQLQHSDTIRVGLTNAYLNRNRYLSPWERSNGLRDLYPIFPEGGQTFLQNIHNGLLSPFLYRGGNDDAHRAEQLYQQFFDEPIQKAERVAIREALQATANSNETKAVLLDLDQKVVRLASQDATVEAHGDWGSVKIHEHYENPTPEDQEIFYSFSLPESAVITGLWLGTADNPTLFPHVVSPRGAAQQVYNDEVERAKFQRATDPALLEQVGPRQYRLRIFPIPASTATSNRAMREPGELDLTLTYDVMAQPEAGWPLPQLSEKRNIFWNSKTEHKRGNHSVQLSEDEWFEPAIAATRSPKPTSHQVTFSEGFRVVAEPLTRKERQLPSGDRIAVVVDSSYSMGSQADELKQAIAKLKEAEKQNTVDFYVAVAGQPTAPKQSTFDTNSAQFYGTLQPADMLTQFASGQTGNQAYDALVLITDEGSYELAEDNVELPTLTAPLWIVHLGGDVPAAYEDNLLQSLEASKGGVDTQVLSVLQKIALADTEATILDGYRWQVEPLAEQTAGESTDDQFTALAARQFIRAQSRTLDISQVEALDEVHVIAKRTSIVTPYSSMLVLVDERQREALRKAEASEDRFEREVEDGQDDLTQPGNELAASVPEPGQILGLFVMAIALITLKRKSVRTIPPQI